MHKTVILMAAAMLLGGCASDGSFCPPDPLGRAVFTYFHNRAQERRAASQQSDQEMIRQSGEDSQYLNSPSPTSQGRTGGRPQEYLVSSPRPPLQNEAQPAPPGYAHPAWIDGYWKWNGSQWIWQPGKWVKRPRSGAEWIAAQYYTINGQNYWRDGYWN